MIADFESICVGRVCQESEDLSVPLTMSCLCVDVLYLIYDYFCHVVVHSLFHVSTLSKVAGGERCAVALCSGRQSPFLEVRFDRRLPRREAEHPPTPYCPIPYGAKRYT